MLLYCTLLLCMGQTQSTEQLTEYKMGNYHSKVHNDNNNMQTSTTQNALWSNSRSIDIKSFPHSYNTKLKLQEDHWVGEETQSITGTGIIVKHTYVQFPTLQTLQLQVRDIPSLKVALRATPFWCDRLSVTNHYLQNTQYPPSKTELDEIITAGELEGERLHVESKALKAFFRTRQ